MLAELQGLIQEAVKLPKRAKKFGVGKLIGGALYLHKQYKDVIPLEIYDKALELSKGFPFNIVKYNIKKGNITFIQSPDFDEVNEPRVGKAVLVKADETVKQMKPLPDPWIYHHKWLFVKDNYKGFNVEEAKERSRKWLSLPDIDFSRIGKRSFWVKLMNHHKLDL